jgi:hypothetical protein
MLWYSCPHKQLGGLFVFLRPVHAEVFVAFQLSLLVYVLHTAFGFYTPVVSCFLTFFFDPAGMAAFMQGKLLGRLSELSYPAFVATCELTPFYYLIFLSV